MTGRSVLRSSLVWFIPQQERAAVLREWLTPKSTIRS